MYLTPAQIKGRIKNVAKQNGSDPITNGVCKSISN